MDCFFLNSFPDQYCFQLVYSVIIDIVVFADTAQTLTTNTLRSPCIFVLQRMLYTELRNWNLSQYKVKIMSQYNAQCAEIRKALSDSGYKTVRHMVDTVVSSQGTNNCLRFLCL